MILCSGYCSFYNTVNITINCKVNTVILLYHENYIWLQLYVQVPWASTVSPPSLRNQLLSPLSPLHSSPPQGSLLFGSCGFWSSGLSQLPYLPLSPAVSHPPTPSCLRGEPSLVLSRSTPPDHFIPSVTDDLTHTNILLYFGHFLPSFCCHSLSKGMYKFGLIKYVLYFKVCLWKFRLFYDRPKSSWLWNMKVKHSHKLSLQRNMHLLFFIFLNENRTKQEKIDFSSIQMCVFYSRTICTEW